MITNVAAEFPAASAMWGQIDLIVQEELAKAKIPNSTVAIIQGENVEYLSYPDAAADSEQMLDMYALFQIGSVSKAYTGLGILLLEDDGLLSLEDPVSKYLPWFTVSYEGKTVPSDVLTIADLIYHTSGFTNSESKYPNAIIGISLEESVRQINESELAF